MPNLSIRLSDDEAETLDRLVVAVRHFYDRQADEMPLLGQVSRETTRSSALRDLLLAWKHNMNAVECFPRNLTDKAED